MQRSLFEMQRTDAVSDLNLELPPITMNTDDAERLLRLAEIARRRLPNAAALLTREVERANVVSRSQMLPGVVTMGSAVEYRDDATGQVRNVTLCYPHDANLAEGRISVLTPIGAALIGLSVNQSIEWETPLGERRLLTVLHVGPAAGAAGPAVAEPANP
jgi:regulator of nucleoside diphosphate kinase